MKKIIQEKDIQDSIKPIPIKSMEIILEQMKNCVCKIHSGKTKGTRFFTKIPFKNTLIPVLITNNHVLSINDIMYGKNITISLNNETIFKNIIIDEKRKRYTNEILDVTIIELNEKTDGIKYFLALDNQILLGFNSKNNGENNYFNNIYKNESIYLLNYLRSEQIYASYGLLESVDLDEINHKCISDKGSSGSPILLLKNNKVIGVHNGNFLSDSKFNFGKLLVKPLIEFQNIQNASNNMLAITQGNSIINHLSNNISKKVNKSMDLSKTYIKNINNINNINNSKKNNINSSPLIGLDNIGATCYMNATLQCLCNIKPFVEYFKYNKQLKNIVKKDIKNEKLCSSFKFLIQNLIPSPNMPKKSSYSALEFKNKISRMNPLFEKIAAYDARDLIVFLFEKLKDELNTPISNQVDNNFGNMLMDRTNKETMYNEFLKYFEQNYRSVISDLFYAFKCWIYQCLHCKKIYYNYQSYFYMNFHLEEVRKYKLQNNTQVMNNNFDNKGINNIVDIYDCFAYEQKLDFFSGDNMIYCNYCRKERDASSLTLLTSGPNILIIIINRGKGNEFNVKINFYLELNLNNYIEDKNKSWKYELFGVISHVGESGMGDHFIAYCKKDDYHQWFKFDDSIVKPVYNFENEVLNDPMPCVLFYRLKNF